MRTSPKHVPGRVFATAALTMVLGLGLAQAAPQSSDAINTDKFEVYQGDAPRVARSIAFEAPRQHAAWQAFLAAEGGTWKALWDTETDVPLRVYGSGSPAPGAIASPEAAEAHAWTFLARHIELLAPGASVSDFVMASNHELNGIRSVGFWQTANGLPVIGGQVSFRFKFDRMLAIGSEAFPHVSARPTSAPVSDARAQQSAMSWIASDFGADSKLATDVSEQIILPLVRRGDNPGAISFHTVRIVRVESSAPIGRWDVYVDAHTSNPVARRQTLSFGNGVVLFTGSERRPGSTRMDYPAAEANLTVDGQLQVADADGSVTWPGNSDASVTARLRGPYTRVINSSGPDATTNLTLPDGGTATWDELASETLDAQINAFVHSTIVKNYSRPWNPTLSWLDETLRVTVNINQSCNAFSDGDSINFYRADGMCENTARLADVVYHEFGHSLHSQSIIPGVGNFNGAMSEGAGDYLAATIVDDPGMGRGFTYSDDPLRHIDPQGTEAFYPDDIINQVHTDGLIYGGTFWDLRKDLIASLGAQAGVEQTDIIYYGTLQRAVDMPSSYVEALVEDDDDGDIDNGTPNKCAIDRVFALHGLAEPGAGGTLVRNPTVTGLSIAVQVEVQNPECAVDVSDATLSWNLRTDPAQSGQVAMNSAADEYVGAIPVQEPGSVVQYQVNMTMSDGTTRRFPENPADELYELFVGEVEEIYCTDFETDPAADGWTHSLLQGDPGEGADDWAWGPPQAPPASGDPQMAYSGTRVYGNDLGGLNFNGLYQANKVNETTSPAVDVSGYDSVRLQYRRWLNVEDAFFDQGSIHVNGTEAWTNLNTNQGNNSDTHHTDREWRFHDMDLTSYVQNDQVQVQYRITSDAGLEFGGWTIDDFCIVGYVAPVCGDGQQSIAEECDDGAGNSDTDPDACRTTCVAPTCGDSVVDSGEECDDGNMDDADGCLSTCLIDVENPPGEEAGGCCDASAGPSGPLFLAFLVFGFLAVLRRRRLQA